MYLNYRKSKKKLIVITCLAIITCLLTNRWNNYCINEQLYELLPKLFPWLEFVYYWFNFNKLSLSFYLFINFSLSCLVIFIFIKISPYFEFEENEFLQSQSIQSYSLLYIKFILYLSRYLLLHRLDTCQFFASFSGTSVS